MSESRVLADFTDFADFRFPVYLTAFVVLRLSIRLFSMHYALESVNVENTLSDINLEDVILEFVGMPTILPKSEVVEAIELAGISGEPHLPF